MKKKLTLILFVFCSATAFAQTTKINAYASYVFDDSIDSYYDPSSYYNGKIKGGLLWGAGIEFAVRNNSGLELLYLRQDTHAPMNYYLNGVKYTNFALANNFIMLGGTQYFNKSGAKFDGFLGWQLGAAIIDISNPDNGYSDSSTKFAWGIKGGGDYWLSDALALKFQVQLLSAVQSAGGGFYFGTGGGGVGVSTVSSMLQFGIGGGLVYRLGSRK